MIKAFTLVELAIVVVIIGLLTAGVLAGQELVKQAEQRRAIKEMESLKSSVNIYKAKYNALPGDQANAASFFNNCSGTYTANNCNGDGNGLYNGTWSNGESLIFWSHLSLAKIAQFDTKSGVRNYAISNAAKNALWTVRTGGASSTSFGWTPGNLSSLPPELPIKNYFIFTGHTSGVSSDGAVITTEDAFGIDSKIDDGLPQTGSAMAGKGSGTSASLPCIGTGNNYSLDTNNVIICNIFFDLE